jgi:hypothetical protein
VLNRTSLPSDIIAFVVFCRLRYRLTLRDLSEILLLRGIEVSHETVRDWETKLLPVMGEELRKCRHGKRRGSGVSWYVDETCLKVRGKWAYLYRASSVAETFALPRTLHQDRTPFARSRRIPDPTCRGALPMHDSNSTKLNAGQANQNQQGLRYFADSHVLWMRLCDQVKPIEGGTVRRFRRLDRSVKALSIKDNSLAEVRFEQTDPGRQKFAVEPGPTDFVAFARGCGAEGIRCRTPERIHLAIEAALASPKAAIIEAAVDAEQAAKREALRA